MRKVLFVASEAVPYIKTGGLADVVGSLPKCFPKEYFDVRVIIPKYACMKEELKNQLRYVTNFYMDLNWRQQYVGIFESEYEGIKFSPTCGEPPTRMPPSLPLCPPLRTPTPPPPWARTV